MEFQVNDMSCGHCVRSITQAVQALDQAAHVEVDLERKRVTVQTTATSAAVSHALFDAGYTPVALA